MRAVADDNGALFERFGGGESKTVNLSEVVGADKFGIFAEEFEYEVCDIRGVGEILFICLEFKALNESPDVFFIGSYLVRTRPHRA